MAFFKDGFLNARRAELLRAICRFQYRIGSTWRDGEINSKQIVGTSVVVFVNVPSFGVNDTISAVRIFDNNDAIAGEQTISLVRTKLNSALLRFTFPLVEE